MENRVAIEILGEDGAQYAHVKLIRAEKMNALDPDMFNGIVSAIEQLKGMKHIRAVVLSGEGRSFCAGLDMASMAGGADPSGGKLLTDRTYGNSNIFQYVATGWRQLPMPVIAAVHGVCFGGGLQIMSGADVKFVTPDARLSVMEMKWGLVPDMGGFHLWRGNVRADILRHLTYSNEEFNGQQAVQYGFATHVDADPLARALELAATIAGKNPDAIRAAKRLFDDFIDGDEDAVLMAESVAQNKVMRKPNQIEAVMAGMQKREAKFTD
ncbi:enoyl-CoA hydratase [Sphingorhabdus lutea]|uniref:Enoyl-CoA hydratase n=1 Tax=Sphingorhabdus lutea TaxID=1913578 RepID=A0A1L3JAI0_9SPHN|nr:crotonase/enoyl-CoA hydratase family protein [Sphingorhabdus lutea]APG62131.1 enoyl-CoA hydratase [Sphingorhabdus lutea]